MEDDQTGALALFEKSRWPEMARCPYCESTAKIYKLRSAAESFHRMSPGTRKCALCRRKFTVTTGTIFAASHISLSKWIEAVELLCCATHPATSLELQKKLGLKSYRSALFLSRRLRWAMEQVPRAKVGSRGDAVAVLKLLMPVEPSPDMPRPGAHRQTSVWADVEKEMR